MRNIYIVAARLLLGLFCVFVPLTGIAALLPHKNPDSQYMAVVRDSKIYAQVGDKVITVGSVRQGEIFNILPVEAEYYEFRFGNGTGFIDRNDLRQDGVSKRPKDSLGDLSKKSYQNLITVRTTPVYAAMNRDHVPFANLAGNLRYPVLGKLKDHLNQTWYEINIGDRLGYVSELDAEPDNGIAVLTYHHILRNEENRRFRNTSTTTSDVAFSNQMTYLHQSGYETISMYQLEGYLNGSLNLPAKVVALTFDDGLKSVYRYAYPVLKRYGMHATAFIISSRIKRHPQPWNPNSLQFMSIAELQEIQDVFDIQSHTHFLHRLGNNKQPILLSRNYRNILYDFERSRRALTQFNARVQYLSYPFGGYNQKAMNAARGSGLHLAVVTVRGKVKVGDNPFALKRLYILRTDSIQSMAERIANKPGSVVAKPVNREKFQDQE